MTLTDPCRCNQAVFLQSFFCIVNHYDACLILLLSSVSHIFLVLCFARRSDRLGTFTGGRLTLQRSTDFFKRLLESCYSKAPGRLEAETLVLLQSPRVLHSSAAHYESSSPPVAVGTCDTWIIVNSHSVRPSEDQGLCQSLCEASGGPRDTPRRS